MWRHQAVNDSPDEPLAKDKDQVDTNVDSGFLSGSNLISSEYDIDDEQEKQQEDSRVEPEPTQYGTSGTKQSCVEPLDSGLIELTSEEFDEAKAGEERALEPWEIYYTQDDDGDTQLHCSIVEGFTEAAFYLIQIVPHPCLLNILNDNSESALHLAVSTHQPKIVRRLILAGADLTVRNLKGNTPLHLACISGDLNCVKALTIPFTQAERAWLRSVKRKPLNPPQNLQLTNYDGEMCLHKAAEKGHVNIMRQLVAVGADLLGREGRGGLTALHLAIHHKRRDVIKFLLHECKREPQLQVKSFAGLNAYHFAYYEDKQLADELVKLGATPSTPPDLFSDSDDDEEEDEEKEGFVEEKEGFVEAMSRLGISNLPTLAIA